MSGLRPGAIQAAAAGSVAASGLALGRQFVSLVKNYLTLLGVSPSFFVSVHTYVHFDTNRFAKASIFTCLTIVDAQGIACKAGADFEADILGIARASGEFILSSSSQRRSESRCSAVLASILVLVEPGAPRVTSIARISVAE